jgi:hypothetical protein
MTNERAVIINRLNELDRMARAGQIDPPMSRADNREREYTVVWLAAELARKHAAGDEQMARRWLNGEAVEMPREAVAAAFKVLGLE